MGRQARYSGPQLHVCTLIAHRRTSCSFTCSFPAEVWTRTCLLYDAPCRSTIVPAQWQRSRRCSSWRSQCTKRRGIANGQMISKRGVCGRLTDTCKSRALAERLHRRIHAPARACNSTRSRRLTISLLKCGRRCIDQIRLAFLAADADGGFALPRSPAACP